MKILEESVGTSHYIFGKQDSDDSSSTVSSEPLLPCRQGRCDVRNMPDYDGEEWKEINRQYGKDFP